MKRMAFFYFDAGLLPWRLSHTPFMHHRSLMTWPGTKCQVPAAQARMIANVGTNDVALKEGNFMRRCAYTAHAIHGKALTKHESGGGFSQEVTGQAEAEVGHRFSAFGPHGRKRKGPE